MTWEARLDTYHLVQYTRARQDLVTCIYLDKVPLLVVQYVGNGLNKTVQVTHAVQEVRPDVVVAHSVPEVTRHPKLRYFRIKERARCSYTGIYVLYRYDKIACWLPNSV